MRALHALRALCLPRRWPGALWLATWLAWAGAAYAGHAPAVQRLAPGFTEASLGPAMQVLHDAHAALALPDAQSAPAWRAHLGPTLSAGFSPGAWWLRVRVVNDTGRPLEAVLDVGTPLQDRITLWQQDGQGSIVAQDEAGDRLPQDRWPVASRTPTFPVMLAAGEQRDLVLRLATHDGLHEAVTPALRSAAAQVRHVQDESLAFGLYFGTLLSLLLYNLFLFASTRDRSFLLYVLHLAAFGLWWITFRGYGLRYAWPADPVLNHRLLAASISASFATSGLFQMHYTQLRPGEPGLYRLMRAGVVLNVLCMLAPFVGGYAGAFVLASLAGMVLMGVAVCSTVSLLRRGSRPALFVAVSYAVLCAGVALYYLRVLGALPPGPITEYGLEVGSAVQVLLLAFGVADRMNTLKAQKLQAERDALAAQTALAHRLDALVLQRTRDLEEANQRLAEISITDELTGAYNRRHFNEVFAAEVARHERQDVPLLFALFDVDHFKAYNDRYGHPAGDEVLRRIAATVRGRLRRSGDRLFRLGGEEFGVLLSVERTTSDALPFVEELCEAIPALRLPHEGSPLGVVSASFGLVVLGAGDRRRSPDSLYALADQRLYEAKRAGRNRVVAG